MDAMPQAAAFERHPATPRPTRREVDSRALLEGSRELVIRHGEQEYRLRLTQNDKLILTK